MPTSSGIRPANTIQQRRRTVTRDGRAGTLAMRNERTPRSRGRRTSAPTAWHPENVEAARVVGARVVGLQLRTDAEEIVAPLDEPVGQHAARLAEGDLALLLELDDENRAVRA